MLGPFLVTLFLAMLGIVAHVLRMAARKTRKAAHELGIDEKVHRVTCMHLHYNTTITTIIIAVVLLVLLLRPPRPPRRHHISAYAGTFLSIGT